MIISRAEIESAVGAYRTSVKRKPGMDAATYDADRYEASGGMSALFAFAANVFAEPLYRTNLVAELHRRISEGRYFVPADQIVEKLIGRLVVQAVSA
ncbi:MAG: hypothetical protein NVSMB64_19710 [Candidatus Velthaea sp.]